MNPRHNDWDNFWKREETQKFTKISWSKKRIMSVIEPHLKPGMSALDAGCGSGFFSKYFCDKGLRTVSLDYSERALEIARKITNGTSKIIKEDLCSAQLSYRIRERFDVIFTDGLLEHFSAADQDRILINFLELLSPGGNVVTFVPNKFSPWEIIRPIFMPGIDETPFVLSRLVSLHQRNNMSVLQAGGINTLPFRFSPDQVFGKYFGMLLYVVARKNDASNG